MYQTVSKYSLSSSDAKLQDYQQYSIQSFSGVKAEEDTASITRSLREKELRSKDKFCPECEGRVWPIDGISVGDNVSYHQSCVVCAECGLGPDQDVNMVLGPKDRYLDFVLAFLCTT